MNCDVDTDVVGGNVEKKNGGVVCYNVCGLGMENGSLKLFSADSIFNSQFNTLQ